MPLSPLSTKLWPRIIWRSFFIQGAWNFEGMQNIGFVYGLIPGLKNIYGDNTDKMDEAIRRYINFFNTQPYMAPLIMGMCLNGEKKGNPDAASQAKMSTAGALAAIGDSFFWGALKPIILLFALICVMINLLWGVLLALILFNCVHVWVMTKGFKKGYEEGPSAALRIGKILPMERVERIKYIIPFMCGVLLFVLPFYMGLGVSLSTGGLLLGGFIAFTCMNRLGINQIVSFYMGFIVLVIWFMVG
ncbi:MAG: PTS system mannose/fructose/sorbose family transporter subunit IID [Thermodesulfobacteriota bacterium]|nr:PTS system mannose/fructose/sorbose family transporter subunit IID [Thermodesulfobacteriota bacterium]